MTNTSASTQGTAPPDASLIDAGSNTANNAPSALAQAPPRRRRPAVEPTGNRRLEVIDLDTIVASVPAPNTPLGLDDDTLAYFDAGEVECDDDNTAEEDTDSAMPADRKGWQPEEVMQLAWIRHDFDEQYRSQTRLQGQNHELMLYDKVRARHPGWRHGFAATKAKVFRMETHYRKVRDLLLKPSGKGKPPKIPIFYDIFERFLGERANARPPALARSLPGANTPVIPPVAAATAGKFM
ncbi:unnamed protein product [Closterium sp. Yama58-4]|nr:unnamed protein product [Closterium sp. Yama58-4]